MSEFSITSFDFNEGEEIPKKFGYKHGNERPALTLNLLKELRPKLKAVAIIMDDPDAMKAVGKVWVHYLRYVNTTITSGKDLTRDEYEEQVKVRGFGIGSWNW